MDQAKRAAADRRMKQHKVICYFGAALLVWTDKAALLNGYNHTSTQVGLLYLTFALLSVLFGIVASSFPDSAPCATAVAWNGSLHAFLFTIYWLLSHGAFGGSFTP